MNAPWRTLRGRLALASLAGLLVATLAFTGLGIQLVRTQTLEREVDDLNAKAKGIGSLMSQDFNRQIQSQGGFNPSPERIATLKAIAGNETELVWTGVNPDPTTSGGALDREAIDQVDVNVLQRDGVQNFEYRRASDRQRRIAAAAPVVADSDVVAAVVLTRERSAVFSVWRRVAGRVLLAAALGLGAALLLSTLLTTRALRPLRRLQTAANAVGQGDLHTRVEGGGTEEIDTLAASFNAMVRELRHREHLSREFLMRVTHDLRTPLTAIRGHTQALADGVVPPEMVQRSLTAIDGESQRLSGMVTDLLDLAKLEAGRFKLDIGEVDASELVGQAFDAHIGEAARLQIKYHSEFDKLPTITTDPARVRQVLGNLIDNAFRWTPPAGAVRVAAASGVHGGIIITICDSGPGIPVNRQEEVFEPFRSDNTPDGRSGSGLGLAIGRQLARALGGDLYIDATFTTGSAFVLELPQDAPTAPDPDRPETQRAGTDRTPAGTRTRDIV